MVLDAHLETTPFSHMAHLAEAQASFHTQNPLMSLDPMLAMKHCPCSTVLGLNSLTTEPLHDDVTVLQRMGYHNSQYCRAWRRDPQTGRK